MIEFFDNSVMEFLNSTLNCTFMDKFMVFVTRLGDYGIIWVIAALILISIKKYRHFGIVLLLSLSLSAITGSLIIKPLVARIRPYIFNNITDLLIAPPSGYSFPSGHTFTSFASAMVLFKMNKRIGIVSFVLAFLIGVSRIYLHAHYPTDVLSGIIFGIVVGEITFIISNLCVKKIEKESK